MNFKSLPAPHWLAHADFTMLAQLPWNAQGGFQVTASPDALSLGGQSNPLDTKWPTVQLQPLPGGKLAVGYLSDIFVLEKDGSQLQHFHLPTLKGFSDLALTPEGLLVFSNVQEGMLSLTTKAGAQSWQHTGGEYQFAHLLPRGDIFYGVRMLDKKVNLIPINLQNGSLGDPIETAAQVAPVFAGKNGAIEFLSYNPATKQRVWNRQVPGQQAFGNPVPAELFGTFAFPCGTDDRGNAYGATGQELGKFARDGSGNWTAKIEALVPSDHDVFWMSVADATHLQVMRKLPNAAPEHLDLHVPEGLHAAAGSPKWRLIQVKGEKLTFAGRNGRTYATSLIVYDDQTSSFSATNASKKLAETGTFVQGSRSWALATDGTFVVPVAGPENLYLIKVRID